jgi:hypothetical protein
MRNRAQPAPRDPSAAAFVTRYRPPATSARLFASRVASTTYRPGTGDYDQSGLAFRGAIKCNVGVTNYHDFTNADVLKCVVHARAQLETANAGETNFRCDEIRSPQTRGVTRFVYCFANCCCCLHNTNTQRV